MCNELYMYLGAVREREHIIDESVEVNLKMLDIE
jgi:hypothetical protein